MSPEKTIRWAAAIFVIPLVFLIVLAAAAAGMTQGTIVGTLILLALVLVPSAVLVAFSSRIAAGILFLFCLAVTLFVLLDGAFAFQRMHLLAKIRVLTELAYCAATTVVMFSAFHAAMAIQRAKRGAKVAAPVSD